MATCQNSQRPLPLWFINAKRKTVSTSRLDQHVIRKDSAYLQRALQRPWKQTSRQRASGLPSLRRMKIQTLISYTHPPCSFLDNYVSVLSPEQCHAILSYLNETIYVNTVFEFELCLFEVQGYVNYRICKVPFKHACSYRVCQKGHSCQHNVI